MKPYSALVAVLGLVAVLTGSTLGFAGTHKGSSEKAPATKEMKKEQLEAEEDEEMLGEESDSESMDLEE